MSRDRRSEAVLLGKGVMAILPISGRSASERLKDQIELWRQIRQHFLKTEFRPRLLLLGVDPWPNRPPIQPWLDTHFAGLTTRKANRVEMDLRCLDNPLAMDLLTNIMRTLPYSPSGVASELLPLIHALVIEIEDVTQEELDRFLSTFPFGGVPSCPFGSLGRRYRQSMIKHLGKRPGGVTIHPTLGGVDNSASIYAGDRVLNDWMDVFCSHLARWYPDNNM